METGLGLGVKRLNCRYPVYYFCDSYMMNTKPDKNSIPQSDPSQDSWSYTLQWAASLIHTRRSFYTLRVIQIRGQVS
jgi:hypothetical protein